MIFGIFSRLLEGKSKVLLPTLVLPVCVFFGGGAYLFFLGGEWFFGHGFLFFFWGGTREVPLDKSVA